MDEFSYLSVLLSIIVGLAITQILQGFRGIVLSRTHVRVFWPVPVWAASLLLINVQSWWAMFSLREVSNWTFAAFAVVLAQTIVQYLLAAIVFPDFPTDRETDLGEHYWAHTRWFFGLLILLLVLSLSKSLVVDGHLPETKDLAFHIGFITLSATVLLTRRDGYHKFFAALGLVLICTYVIALFTHLH